MFHLLCILYKIDFKYLKNKIMENTWLNEYFTLD